MAPSPALRAPSPRWGEGELRPWLVPVWCVKNQLSPSLLVGAGWSGGRSLQLSLRRSIPEITEPPTLALPHKGGADHNAPSTGDLLLLGRPTYRDRGWSGLARARRLRRRLVVGPVARDDRANARPLMPMPRASGPPPPSWRARLWSCARKIRRRSGCWRGRRLGWAGPPPPWPSINGGSNKMHSRPKTILSWGSCTSDRGGPTRRRGNGKSRRGQRGRTQDARRACPPLHPKPAVGRRHRGDRAAQPAAGLGGTGR